MKKSAIERRKRAYAQTLKELEWWVNRGHAANDAKKVDLLISLKNKINDLPLAEDVARIFDCPKGKAIETQVYTGSRAADLMRISCEDSQNK
jgi:hypothetical protein